MAIKKVEPLKFKGNKVYYLHKLSEKGADAIKCDFPNGDDTFTETTLQAAIEELAASGGGGGGGSSTPSAQPDRVIIIDSTLTEDIAGKAYSTFSAAKTYMEANPLSYYCVELPAGEFNEAVTISDHWMINGNATQITQPLRTTVEFSLVELQSNYSFSIQNCEILAGFTPSATAPKLSVFGLKDCIINDNACGDSSVFVVGSHCIVNSIASSNAIMYLLYSLIKNCNAYQLSAVHSLLTENVESTANTNLMMCFAMNTFTYSGFEFDAYDSDVSGKLDTTKVALRNTKFDGRVATGATINLDKCPQVEIRDDGETINSVINCSSTNLSVSAKMTTSTIIMDAKSSLTFGVGMPTIGTLECACNTLIKNAAAGVISNSYQPQRFRYSSDGGSTFLPDATGATHVGIIKDPNAIYVSATAVTEYIWIPLS